MALALRTLRLSAGACPSCAGRAAVSGPYTSVRGAKKMAREPNISVMLLQDIPKFGPKGSVLSVARGRMRNKWYPMKMAEYISKDELKNIPTHQRMGRDPTFMPVQEELFEKEEVDRVSALDTRDTLEKILPPTLQFQAKPIVYGQPEIHGSINIASIAAAIRHVLGSVEGSELAKRVVVSNEMITIADGADEQGRIKNLGEYPFVVDVGAGLKVRRTVTVVPDAFD